MARRRSRGCAGASRPSTCRGGARGEAFLGLPFSVPSQVGYYQSGRMQALVDRLLAEERPTRCSCKDFRMAPFVRRAAHPCKVLFLADSLALSLGRSLPYQAPLRGLGVRWERRRVAAYEPAVSHDFRESWVLSEVDARDLGSRGAERIAVVPHGVDERCFERPLDAPPGANVTFLGNLSVPHNVDAACFLAREIWPLVRAARPRTTLEIVGADPVPAVLALAELPGVTVTGPVPELLPVWARSALLLAPLRYSAGIQNKVLEAMAAGVPVVTTPPAAEAIGARHGIELRTGADAASLAREALTVLGDAAACAPMRAAGRALVRERFSWSTLVERLERLAGTPEPA